jgi:hypothetical protein
MFRFRTLTVLGLCGLALAAGTALASVGSGLQASRGPTSFKAAGSRAIDTSCSAQTPGQLGLLARVAPGHSARELQAQGYRVYAALGQSPGQLASDRDLLVEIGSRLTGGPSTDVAALRRNAALSSAGAVLSQSLDPALRSCNYRLDDRPAAQHLVGKAEVVMVRNGLVSNTELAADSTIFLIGDNPLNQGQVIVTIAVAGATIPDPFENPSRLHSLIPIVAIVDKSSGRVLQAGFGAWYATS